MKKKEKIIRALKDNLERDVEFATDQENLYNYEETMELIKAGVITNAQVEIDRHGYKKIKFDD